MRDRGIGGKTGLALVCALATACVVAPAAESALTNGGAAIRELNEQRAANGIGPVKHHGDLTVGCANHLNYMAINGDTFLSEDPAKPGYTPLGAGDPDSSPVYANGYMALFSDLPAGFLDFAAGSNPWLHGPGHQAAMFDPTFTLGGYAAINRDGGAVRHCMRLSGATSQVRLTLKAFTGIEGRANVPYSVRVLNEGPLSPQQAAGLGTAATGPVITFYAYRPDRQPLRPHNWFLLKGSHRITDVRFLAGTTENTPVSRAMHGPASAMIPAVPLKPNTTYTAIVNWVRGSGLVKQTVSFTTGNVALVG
jgi:uncharacterized protein YkwD